MKKLVVLGAGESGRGVALLAKSKGYAVKVSDAGPLSNVAREELVQASIPFEEGGHSTELLSGVDLVVKSPGIPWEVAIVASAKTKGIPVIGEMEFCAPYQQGRVVGITGSNGKTTTTKLIGHLLAATGFDVAVGGNIGTSYARLLLSEPREVYVLELSSYQLEDISAFAVDVGMVLNLSPDHLDRYQGSFAKYAATKYQLARTQKVGAIWLQAGDELSQAFAKTVDRSAEVQVIDLPATFTNGCAQTSKNTYSLAGTVLQGPHNAANASFALEAVEQLLTQKGLLEEQGPVLAKALQTFVNAPHRLEPVGVVAGVLYINDSKATNIDAVAKALASFKAPLVWILGGTDKGNDYAELEPLLRSANIRAAVAMGLENEKICAAFAHYEWPTYSTSSMDAALSQARTVAKTGDIVLLSPACASFDLFENYIDRGNQFKAGVRAQPGFTETLNT